MARHRNVRSMNYADEYDGYDDVYGHSVEDDYSISPSDAGYVFNRDQKAQMSAFMTGDEDIAEEDEDFEEGNEAKKRRDSDSLQLKTRNLNDVDEARLRSCLDEIRNVIGDTVTEATLVDIILDKNFDVTKSLDAVLSNAATDNGASLPQREPQTRSDKDDNLTFMSSLGQGLQQLDLDSGINPQKDASSQRTIVLPPFRIPKLPKVNLSADKENLHSEPGSFFSLLSTECYKLEQNRRQSSEGSNTDVISKGCPATSPVDLHGTTSKLHVGTSGFKPPPLVVNNISIKTQPKLSIPPLVTCRSSPSQSVNVRDGEDSDDDCASLSALMAQHSTVNSELEHTSLSSLAKQHLKGSVGTSAEKPKFFIPSLVPDKQMSVRTDDCTDSTLSISVGLKEESSGIGECDIDPGSGKDEFVIDLMNALNPPDIRQQLERPESRTRTVEIELDLEESVMKPWVHDHNCMLDASSVLLLDQMQEKESSSLGRVLCRRRNARCVPYIRPRTPLHSGIIPFMFNTPSPDSIGLKLRRRIV